MAEESGFLSRWARRKAEVKSGKPVPSEPVVQVAPAVDQTAAVVPAASLAAEAAAVDAPVTEAPAPPLPTLDDVASLVPGDEISRFVARGVDENVKRAAIKKLFTDPHYNVMDGLDIYIDDYSLPDPIPMAMLRQTNQSKFMGLFAEEDAKEEAEEAEAAAAAARAEAAASPEPHSQDAGGRQAAAVPQTPDEDADLQLQPDDDARRTGAATRAGSDGL